MNDSTPWRVVFHHVKDPDRQQRILAAVAHVDRPGLRALGTSNGSSCFVALECRAVADELAGGRIVRAIDASASVVQPRGQCEGLARRVRLVEAPAPIDA